MTPEEQPQQPAKPPVKTVKKKTVHKKPPVIIEKVIEAPKEVETAVSEKAVSIWGTVRSWKFFWLAVVVLGLGIYTFFLLKLVRPKQPDAVILNQRRADTLKELLRMNSYNQYRIDSEDNSHQRQDIEAHKQNQDATNKSVDFEKKNEIDNALQLKHNKEVHEKINNTPHTPDDYYRMELYLLSDTIRH